ncbi:MAG: TrbI/VirB10 family protein [Pseudobdellovibrio sp.]
MKLVIFVFFISNVALAQNRTNLFKKEVAVQSENKNEVINSKILPSKKKIPVVSENGNLPSEYLFNHKAISIEESPIVIPSNKAGIKFRDLKTGDLITARIQESVFAFQESKSPVRALITSGILKGSILIGEASLERNSKRIQIEFKRFRDPQAKDIFQIQASAMDQKGILGLEGELISNEAKYFSAEVISAGAAGYADSTISRSQNSFGNTVENQSEDSFTKKALTAALSKTADRFSEKLKQAPEYSILEGPIEIQILILEQPALIQ